MLLDTDLREENLFLIASDQEPTPELLEEIKNHPAAYPALVAWAEYVETSGHKVPPPDPPVLSQPEFQDDYDYEPDEDFEDLDNFGESRPQPVARRGTTRPKPRVARDSGSGAPLPTKNTKRTLGIVLGFVAGLVVVCVVGMVIASVISSQPARKPAPSVKATKTAAPAPTSGSVSASGEGFVCHAVGKKVLCFGQSSLGQLGSSANPGVHVGEVVLDAPVNMLSAGADFACANTTKGVSCWGDNRWRQAADTEAQIIGPTLVEALKGKKITSLASGELHTCAVADSKIYCWGSGFSGQLADGKEGPLASGVKEIPLPKGEKPQTVMASRFTSCAVMKSGKTYCWGSNEGQRIAEGEAQHLGLTEMKVSDATD